MGYIKNNLNIKKIFKPHRIICPNLTSHLAESKFKLCKSFSDITLSIRQVQKKKYIYIGRVNTSHPTKLVI